MPILKRILSFSLCFCVSTLGASQNIVLKGQVSIHNSKYRTGQIEYVANAFVNSPFSAPDNTDENGNFHLEFVGIPKGSTIELSVEKYGLEVVNKRDLENVILGRKTSINIFVAEKGLIAKSQTKFYNVSLKAITKNHNELIASLQKEGQERDAVITELEQNLNKVISNHFEAEQVLNDQLKSVKTQLPNFARRMATVNLDFASKMYQEAFEYFKQGEIKNAIKTLDEAVLDEQSKNSITNIDSLKASIQNLNKAIENENERLLKLSYSHLLKARSESVLGNYKQSLESYELAISMLEELGELDTLTFAISEAANLYKQNKLNEKALEKWMKWVEISKELSRIDTLKLAEVYQEIALIYELRNDQEKQFSYLFKVYQIKRTNTNGDNPEIQNLSKKLVEYYYSRGQVFKENGDPKKAIASFILVLEFPIDQKEEKRIKKMIRKLSNKSG